MSDKVADKRALEEMVQGPGWKLLMQTMKDQRDLRLGEYAFKPLDSADKIYAQEFIKGEVSGLALAMVTPEAMIQVLSQQISLDNAQRENREQLEEQKAADARRSRVDDGGFSTG